MMMNEPEDACALEEDDEMEDLEHRHVLRDIRSHFGLEVIRVVSRLHDQLGHPSPLALSRAMEGMGYDQEHVKCAKIFECEHCLRRVRPKAFRIAALPRATSFNDVVCADVMHLKYNGKKRKLLVIQDEHSRFEVDVIIKRETATNETRLWEKHWLSWCGPPRVMRVC